MNVSKPSMPRLSVDEAPDPSGPDWPQLPPPAAGEPRVVVAISVDVGTYEHFRRAWDDWQAIMADALRKATHSRLQAHLQRTGALPRRPLRSVSPAERREILRRRAEPRWRMSLG